ncbi:hypothetical protein [Raineyella sp.]|uniref:hypothetical protein n=1 Tax=Raineyella sp. TaxID=1911550 RepID=UPI002B207334|nr:hypothetical protein [Raineyella sp.]MEA5154387.1 hypothetical protein [Raineyella sp.]
MVLLEVNGGAASSGTEVLVIGILALVIVAIGVLLFRSLKKIDVPYAADVQGQGVQGDSVEADEAGGDDTSSAASEDGRPGTDPAGGPDVTPGPDDRS